MELYIFLLKPPIQKLSRWNVEDSKFGIEIALKTHKAIPYFKIFFSEGEPPGPPVVLEGKSVPPLLYDPQAAIAEN